MIKKAVVLFVLSFISAMAFASTDIQKPVIIVTKQIGDKYVAVAAYFPNDVCEIDPSSNVLRFPHEVVKAPLSWSPCTPLPK
jgi:hypothetical protein